MLRRTLAKEHRGGHSRRFIHRDPSFASSTGGMGARSLTRMGLQQQSGTGFRKTGFFGQSQYDHAFPLLSHDELGHADSSNDTKHVQLSNYMPKRNKGLAPWYRGADTYSVKYSEQGRYEYQRYLMISRFPSEYRKEFNRFLKLIRNSNGSHPAFIPQEAIHWLQRMIVDNFNPQHAHYITAMGVLTKTKEYDMVRDVWRMMERQQTIPDDLCIATYLEACALAGEKTWALEAWNRYCTEKKFLSEGEVDPKPITRVPFTLTRDETLYLPKWKKFFDHDPNLDVTDLNRFNTTRQIYSKMAQVMVASGDYDAFWTFYEVLEKALLTTPTPVPEPPNPLFIHIPKWEPVENRRSISAPVWRLENQAAAQALGSPTTRLQQLAPRFFSNKQFLLHVVTECIDILSSRTPNTSSADMLKFGTELAIRASTALGADFAVLQTEALHTSILRLHRTKGKEGGHQLLNRVKDLLKSKAELVEGQNKGISEPITANYYLQILEGFADQSADRSSKSFEPKVIVNQMANVLRSMTEDPTVEWAADMHLAVVKTLVNCGTMAGNNYFIKNVLRKFPWTSDFLEALYPEYRRAADVDTWAELTKRSLVWTARYNAEVSEKLKRMIEDDYGTIKVQVRSFRELAVFQFRDAEEKRHARDPVNTLPNPYMDFVSHALPFPDRDTGYPNEYGDIGQWRAPNSPIKGPNHFAPAMYGEHLKGFTSEWRDPTNPSKPPAFASPWERKYTQYARGQHPSYDMTYAGPMPEIFPNRTVFRQKTRWDQYDIQKQSKHRMAGPY